MASLISQRIAEPLVTPTSNAARLSQRVIEPVVSPNNIARLSQRVVEVMVTQVMSGGGADAGGWLPGIGSGSGGIGGATGGATGGGIGGSTGGGVGGTGIGSGVGPGGISGVGSSTAIGQDLYRRKVQSRFFGPLGGKPLAGPEKRRK